MKWLFDTCTLLWNRYIRSIVFSPKTLPLLTVLLLAGSTLPLLILGFYNHPSADDFNYTILTGQALRDTQGLASVPAVLGAALTRATSYWGTWQGTYSMSVMAALRPSLWSESLTFMHSFILIGIVIVSVFYLFHIILRKVLGFDTGTYITVSCLTAFLSIQYLPNAVEGFFWYTGGVGYTFFIYTAFMLLGKVILAFHQKKLSIPNTIALCLISFFVAGGHFAITLFGFVFTVFFFVEALIKKDYAKDFKIKYAINTFVYIAGFLLCVCAPGNFRRQQSFEQQGVIETILKAYINGAGYAKLYTNTVVLLGILCIGLITFFRLKRLKLRFAFPYPVVFTLITFSMYAVLLMPGYFSTNGIPAPRYLDIIYFGVILFFSVNIMYYAGWLRNRLDNLEADPKLSYFIARLKPAAVGLVFFILTLYGINNLTVLEIRLSTGMRALTSLKSGEAQEFDQQMDARESLYHDDSLKEVYIDALTVYPELLFFDDITTNKEDYTNYKIAEFYNKEFIVIK